MFSPHKNTDGFNQALPDFHAFIVACHQRAIRAVLGAAGDEDVTFTIKISAEDAKWFPGWVGERSRGPTSRRNTDENTDESSNSFPSHNTSRGITMTAADESKRAENAINGSGASGLCVHCYGLGFGSLKGFAVIVVFQVCNKATIRKVILES